MLVSKVWETQSQKYTHRERHTYKHAHTDKDTHTHAHTRDVNKAHAFPLFSVKSSKCLMSLHHKGYSWFLDFPPNIWRNKLYIILHRPCHHPIQAEPASTPELNTHSLVTTTDDRAEKQPEHLVGRERLCKGALANEKQYKLMLPDTAQHLLYYYAEKSRLRKSFNAQLVIL